MTIFVPFSPFQFKYLGVHNINLTKKYKIADNVIQCFFYIWKVVLSISKGFHLLLDITLKSLKLFEDNLVIH